MPTEYRDIPCAQVDLRNPAPASDAERVAAIEARHAALLADLSKATTLAQVRAAAAKAADL